MRKILLLQNIRQWASSPPPVGSLVAVRNDLLGVAEDFDTSRVFLDLVNRSVELGCPAVGREHVAP